MNWVFVTCCLVKGSLWSENSRIFEGKNRKVETGRKWEACRVYLLILVFFFYSLVLADVQTLIIKLDFVF